MVSVDPPGREPGTGKSPDRVAPNIEFVLMRGDGSLRIGGLSQIRSHTTKEQHKKRRRHAEEMKAILRWTHEPTGNLSFGAQFDALRCLPQLPIESQRPGMLTHVKRNVFLEFGQERMKNIVWPAGTHDSTFFSGMLLMSSTHLDGINSGQTSFVTTALKLEAVKQVRERVQRLTPENIVGCIGAVACMAICGLVRGGKDAAEEYQHHRYAAATLISQAMRWRLNEKSNFCRTVLALVSIGLVSRRCHMPVRGLALALPILNSAAALDEYGPALEDPTRRRLGPDPRLYSPVYDGRVDPGEPPFPHVKTAHLQILLQLMQSIVKIGVDQNDSTLNCTTGHASVLSGLCQRVLDMPPSRKQPHSPYTNDHVYETCRLTSVLLVRSVLSGTTWQALIHEDTMTSDFMHSLHASDPGSLWGKNIGLLYWVMLVWYCAAYGTAHYPYLHALAIRIQFELTFEYDDWHGALLPMVALKDLMPLGQIS